MNRIVGKVSAGLEIVKELVEPPLPAAFVHFGQIHSTNRDLIDYLPAIARRRPAAKYVVNDKHDVGD